MNERLTTMVFGISLSGLLLGMLFLNAISR